MKLRTLLLICTMLSLLLCACAGEGEGKETDAPTGTPAVTTETEAETEPLPEPGSAVFKGTPAIDGVLDDAYLNSFCMWEKPMEHMGYSAAGDAAAQEKMPNTEGKMYLLHDDEWLYFCCVIHDETICSRGKEWRFAEPWPWNDDGAEIYLWFSDDDCMSIHSDAHGLRSVVDEHIWGENHESARTYHDTPMENWAATIDEENQNYTVEIRIALPDYVKSGSKIGTLLEIDDRWSVGDGSDNQVGALFQYPRFPGADNFLVPLA